MSVAITLSSRELHAKILPRGATLAALRFGQDTPNLVLGFADPADHARVPVYAGAIVGPVANRIAWGQLTIDGEVYQMPRNENGETCLHSGPFGLHALDWQVVHQAAAEVTLAIHLQDGDHGLPGNRHISVNYRLEGNTLIIDITAQTDRATPMNIAAHPYWNLDSTARLAGHQLQVAADHYLPVDDRNLPTGDIAETAGSSFDFRRGSPVPVNRPLDVNFCLDISSDPRQPPNATLIGKSGFRLDITTTAPGLQVYNGAFLPDMPGALEEGHDLAPFAGIALEPQFWPDAPHQPQFPQITLTPGEVWKQVTSYRLIAPL